jgi:citrate lyase subunit beta/citryl-CoA lyase
MLVLNPKELPLVHKHYSPSEKEVFDANEMLKLSEEASHSGMGVALMNGKFIGPPMVLAAKKTLKKHQLILKKAN